MKEVWKEIIEGIGPSALAMSIVFLSLMLVAGLMVSFYLNDPISTQLENIHNLNFDTN